VAAGALIEVRTRRLRLVGYGRGGWGDWLMLADTTRVGDLGFRGPPDEEGTVEIGYRVRDEHRRCGYATEAADALVRWALSQEGVARVVATCERRNTASIGVLERIGMRCVLERHGMLRWELAS
jgi:ribosomal-protein-alanine N-acetyltransferase